MTNPPSQHLCSCQAPVSLGLICDFQRGLSRRHGNTFGTCTVTACENWGQWKSAEFLGSSQACKQPEIIESFHARVPEVDTQFHVIFLQNLYIYIYYIHNILNPHYDTFCNPRKFFASPGFSPQVRGIGILQTDLQNPISGLPRFLLFRSWYDSMESYSHT